MPAASIDLHETLYLTGATTVAIHARETTIVADLAEAGFTVTIDEPDSWMNGFKISLIQLNGSALKQVTLNTTAASGDEFRSGGTNASVVTFLLANFDVQHFICAKTGVSTWQWISLEK